MDRGAWWTTIYGVTESDTTEGLTLSISLTPRPQTGTWYQVHSLLGTRPHTGGEWWVGEQAKLHIYLQPLPSTCIIAWASSPVGSTVAALDSHRLDSLTRLSLNHPETVPLTSSLEKLSSMKWVPGAPKRLGTAALNCDIHLSRCKFSLFHIVLAYNLRHDI